MKKEIEVEKIYLDTTLVETPKVKIIDEKIDKTSKESLCCYFY